MSKIHLSYISSRSLCGPFSCVVQFCFCAWRDVLVELPDDGVRESEYRARHDTARAAVNRRSQQMVEKATHLVCFDRETIAASFFLSHSLEFMFFCGSS